MISLDVSHDTFGETNYVQVKACSQMLMTSSCLVESGDADFQ